MPRKSQHRLRNRFRYYFERKNLREGISFNVDELLSGAPQTRNASVLVDREARWPSVLFSSRLGHRNHVKGCRALGSVARDLANDLDYYKLNRVSDVRSCGTVRKDILKHLLDIVPRRPLWRQPLTA